MKRYAAGLLAALALALALAPGLAAADDQKLSKDEFGLVRKVDKIAEDVTELKKQVAELNRKFDKVIAEKDRAAQPKPVTVPPAADAPARPAGDGWQYDPVQKNWWKYGGVLPQAQPAPQYQYLFPQQPACPNGRCPKAG